MTAAGRWFVRVAPAVLLGAVTASLVLRFTVRDTVPGLAALYLATPLVLDAAAAAVAALLAWRTDRTWFAGLCAAAVAVCGALYAGSSFERNAAGTPGDLRGVFWNVEHGSRGWTDVADKLATLDPDVAFLAESDGGGAATDELLAAKLPGRSIVRSRGGLAVIVRGSAELLRFEPLPFRGRIAEFRVTTEGREFTAVFADVGANLRVRHLPLSHVRAAAERHLAAPLLVVGDFNTPRDSAEFDGWRGPLVHAFETTGRGLDATWPSPCPLLSIDHVWSGGGLTVRTCELPWTAASDHLPVVFTFDVP